MKTDKMQKRKFLFNVDIMIEEETNGRALEKLLHLLNVENIEDYQIRQGMELGKKIEAAGKGTPFDIPDEENRTASPSKKPQLTKDNKMDSNYQSESDPHQHIWEEMKAFQQNNTLVRMTIVKGKGVKLSMPCRIINTDPPSGNLTIYHVDEKKVYLIQINEIDDFKTS